MLNRLYSVVAWVCTVSHLNLVTPPFPEALSSGQLQQSCMKWDDKSGWNLRKRKTL
jgi:hypothetical protein